MFVITNMTTEPLEGELRVLSGDETLAERKADTAAIDSFKP